MQFYEGDWVQQQQETACYPGYTLLHFPSLLWTHGLSLLIVSFGPSLTHSLPLSLWSLCFGVPLSNYYAEWPQKNKSTVAAFQSRELTFLLSGLGGRQRQRQLCLINRSLPCEYFCNCLLSQIWEVVQLIGIFHIVAREEIYPVNHYPQVKQPPTGIWMQ